MWKPPLQASPGHRGPLRKTDLKSKHVDGKPLLPLRPWRARRTSVSYEIAFGTHAFRPAAEGGSTFYMRWAMSVPVEQPFFQATFQSSRPAEFWGSVIVSFGGGCCCCYLGPWGPFFRSRHLAIQTMLQPPMPRSLSVSNGASSLDVSSLSLLRHLAERSLRRRERQRDLEFFTDSPRVVATVRPSPPRCVLSTLSALLLLLSPCLAKTKSFCLAKQIPLPCKSNPFALHNKSLCLAHQNPL